MMLLGMAAVLGSMFAIHVGRQVFDPSATVVYSSMIGVAGLIVLLFLISLLLVALLIPLAIKTTCRVSFNNTNTKQHAAGVAASGLLWVLNRIAAVLGPR